MATRKSASTDVVRRRPTSTEVVPAGNYFAYASEKTGITFVSSGCAIMDAALGGGYALGRVINIVGDKSSGKTLKAMELCANFARQFANGWIRYAESEAAFDKPYAGALGIPLDRIIFNDDVTDAPKKKKAKEGERVGGGAGVIETVEDLYDDMVMHLDKFKGRPGLYIIDSLDAISDEAELGREFSEGSYGGTKPKEIGKLFRILTQRMEEQGVIFLVISQLRDKLGVTFGETKTRSGGKALDFYATHIVWLAEIKKIKRTINKIERIVGVEVLARVKKNKVGLPFREAGYSILFGYGIDDLTANVEWLIDVGRESLLADLGLSKAGYKVRIGHLRDKGGPEVVQLRKQLTEIVFREWALIETDFLPSCKKY